jgi:hypothetical protein
MDRLSALESSTDITISTFPLPRAICRTRSQIARNRHLKTYFENNMHNFRDIYMDYQWFWHELHACILEDIRTRIRSFAQLHNQTLLVDPQNNTIIQGYLAGCDANAASFLKIAFQIVRDTFVLRTTYDALRMNTFYRTANPALIQTITQFVYDCIVAPRPGGFVFSFHPPTADQIEADDRNFITHIVVNEDEFYDDHVHTVPVVPFLLHGGSGRVFDGNAFDIALPYPVRLQNDDTRVQPNADDLLHDYDIVFQTQFRAPPENPGDYTRLNNAIEILTNGHGAALRADLVLRYQLFCDYL